MLDYYPLDDQGYADILDAGLALLPELAPSWTDYNAHDPGMTLLELMSWLTEMQRYYLSQITQKHEQKYLKLIGSAQKPIKPARLLVILEAEDNPIILPEGAAADVGGIVYTLEKPFTLHDVDIRLSHSIHGPWESAYGFMAFGTEPQAGMLLYLSLSSPLPPGEPSRIYIEIESAGHGERNPFESSCLPLCAVEAEAFCEKGWLACGLEDGTYGLMQSGWMALTPSEPITASPSGGYLLRLRLTQCEVDTPSMLRLLSLQATEFVQEEWACTPDRPRILTVRDGLAALDTSPLFIVPDSFSLMVEEDGRWREWERVGDLSCSGPLDRHYELDEIEGLLFFGDGLHGRQARQSALITSMRLTRAGSGHVKEKQHFMVRGGGRAISGHNPFHAYGGQDKETIEEAFRRVIAENQKACRAVSHDDYLSIVLGTPGLCIEAAHVYSPADGKVCVCVKPRYGELSGAYVRNIRKRLFERKLPCVELNILPPLFREGTLYAQIRLATWARDKAADVRRFIEDYIRERSAVFGLVISLSEWARDIESLPYADKVEEITMNWRNGETLSPETDFSLPPSGLLRVTGIELQVN